MPSLIKTQKTEVTTKDGECRISVALDITLNINSGEAKVTAAEIKKTTEDKTDKVDWTIPDFNNMNTGLVFKEKG